MHTGKVTTAKGRKLRLLEWYDGLLLADQLAVGLLTILGLIILDRRLNNDSRK